MKPDDKLNWKPIDNGKTEEPVNEKYEEEDDEFIPSTNKRDWVAVDNI
jgi:hypothetical protein